MDPNRVIIFDTTLRDGEQSPGISLNATEKLEIAQQLARLGVDVIEAGFPIASPGDFQAVQAIAREVHGPVIAGLARAHAADIERAAEAVRDAERPRVHTFISTSRHPHPAPAAVHARGRAGPGPRRRRARRARWSTTSSSARWTPPAPTSSSPPRCCRPRSRRARPRSTSRTPSATRCRSSTPRSWAGCTSWSRACATSCCPSTATTTSGLAVANSFAGLQAGARQVECAINGLGERAGNASLEEIVMLLRTREADIGLTTGINTREIARTSRLVSRLTGYGVQPNKADRGPQRVPARVRHPPGRRAQGALDLRDHVRRRPSASTTRTRSCSASTPAATRCSRR